MKRPKPVLAWTPVDTDGTLMVGLTSRKRYPRRVIHRASVRVEIRPVEKRRRARRKA